MKEKKIKMEKVIKVDKLDSSTLSEGGGELSYEEKLKRVNAIAKPMASRKLAKKLFKLIKKSSKQKNYFRNGIKAVQCGIRKNEKGIVILAGDVTPLDIMCHLPAVCEELQLPYAYVPSRTDIGGAMGIKRASIVFMAKEHKDYEDLYKECQTEIEKLPLPI